MDTYSIYDFYEFLQCVSIVLASILGFICSYTIRVFNAEKTKIALTLLILNIISIIVCLYFFICMGYLQVR
jgi:hypothetical protein